MSSLRPLALVTGASSGIGAAYARRLAQAGYGLVLVARRQQRLDDLAAELRGAAQVETIVADLARDPGVDVVAERLRSAPNLEVLVNNAGFGSRGYFFAADAGAQEDMHRLHVLAVERLTQAALPGMVERRKGAIVNVSSVAAFFQSPTSVSYCATKTWMNVFTEGIALDLRSVGSPVKVQALCPGFTYTEFHDVIKMDRSEVPLSFWMRAEDVVEASWRGLEQGRLFVIPGWRYKVIVGLAKALPRWVFTLGAKRVRKPRK